MDTILTVEKPDFVVFGGDQITGENTLWENSTAYLDQVHAAVLKHNTPFASIYGNHDESYNISHLASYAFEKERAAARALSWTQSNRESAGDPKGIFNYYIPVYASASAKTPALLLWFFDSRAGQFNSRYFGVKDEPWMSQDWVDPGVEPWVRDTVAGMRKQWGSVPRSLAFVHIPPRVVRNIADRVTAEPDTHPGINFEAPSIQGYRACVTAGRVLCYAS
jgi:post-segregation antitoxin (ccd killing protein)